MRAGRLLSILLLLQTHQRLTAADLARRLEVSRRTVLRDMDALSVAGIPVYAQRGGGGGWRLLDSYRTHLTGLTDLETQALFAAAPPPVLHDIGLGGAAEAAFIKLLASLPGRQHVSAAHTRQRLYVDGAGWDQRTGTTPHLHTVQDAVWRDRKLRIRYERSDNVFDPRPPEVVERLVDALGLVAKGRSWYLVAASEGRDVLAYRVSRIRAAEIIDEPAIRPPGFDLADYWDRSTAAFKASVPRYDATVRASPAALPLLQKTGPYRRAQEDAAVAPAPTELNHPQVQDDPETWTTIAFRFEVEDEAIPFILRFGGELEVLTPASLRRRVADLAAAAAARYRS